MVIHSAVGTFSGKGKFFLGVFHVPRNRKHSFCIYIRVFVGTFAVFNHFGIVNSDILSQFDLGDL